MSTQGEMMSIVQDFNASVYVSEQLNRQLVNMSQDLAYRCVGALADRYNFDAEEAYRYLNLSLIKVERKAQMKEKSIVVEKVSARKPVFPLPYNGELNDACCYALRQNNGLYTQCTGVRKGEAQFCKGCATLMQKTGSEVPEYGTIQQRQAVGIFEYVDPKGRKPIAYTKVMNKYKINKEQVLEEAGKLNININSEHFVVPDGEGVKRGRPKADKEPKAKGAKGRPKKEKKVLMVEGNDDEDLFATLVANSVANSLEDAAEEETLMAALEDAAEEERLMSGKSTTTDGKKKSSKTNEEKEAERLAKEAEKEAKRIAAELAKKEKDDKLAAEKAEKEQAKLEKKEAERLAREAKKAEEEATKKAKEEQRLKEKEAKLAAEKAEKEQAKLEKKPTKKAAKSSEESAEDEEADVVKKIEFEGKKYLKSKKTGIVYDYNEYVKNGEQVVVGKWNDTTNNIVFEAAEEEEEEYE